MARINTNVIDLMACLWFWRQKEPNRCYAVVSTCLCLNSSKHIQRIQWLFLTIEYFRALNSMQFNWIVLSHLFAAAQRHKLCSQMERTLNEIIDLFSMTIACYNVVCNLIALLGHRCKKMHQHLSHCIQKWIEHFFKHIHYSLFSLFICKTQSGSVQQSLFTIVAASTESHSTLELYEKTVKNKQTHEHKTLISLPFAFIFS